MNEQEWLLIGVGVSQLLVGLSLGLLFHYLRIGAARECGWTVGYRDGLAALTRATKRHHPKCAIELGFNACTCAAFAEVEEP